jgi:hypothetical protein
MFAVLAKLGGDLARAAGVHGYMLFIVTLQSEPRALDCHTSTRQHCIVTSHQQQQQQQQQHNRTTTNTRMD